MGDTTANLSSPSLGERVLGAVVFLRAWIRPDVRIEAVRGEVRFEQKRLRVADEYEGTAPTGLFLHTLWVRDWLLRPHPLKVEILAGEYDNGVQPRKREKVDLLITVGSTVRAGIYVACRGLTAFQVRVRSEN